MYFKGKETQERNSTKASVNEMYDYLPVNFTTLFACVTPRYDAIT